MWSSGMVATSLSPHRLSRAVSIKCVVVKLEHAWVVDLMTSLDKNGHVHKTAGGDIYVLRRHLK